MKSLNQSKFNQIEIDVRHTVAPLHYRNICFMPKLQSLLGQRPDRGLAHIVDLVVPEVAVVERGQRRVGREALAEPDRARIADFVAAEVELGQRRVGREALAEPDRARSADLVAVEVERGQRRVGREALAKPDRARSADRRSPIWFPSRYSLVSVALVGGPRARIANLVPVKVKRGQRCVGREALAEPYRARVADLVAAEVERGQRRVG
eukprot:CAMPEP_0179890382 /NCGR_PEP_ID=MMETSP0982-20121206/33093_1 /TAXON_ID=483367 /ORGANISM="non described non described, Strain CCMP 2436" /LENGTH=208 /DNA_ID=CAMNT_0021786643 /DNA_START=256 /DNA_END=881 /DNA_ORIENTATION=+